MLVAVDGPAAAKLLGLPPPEGWRGVRTLYYAADCPKPDAAPVSDNLLILNGDGSRDGSRDGPTGPINSVTAGGRGRSRQA